MKEVIRIDQEPNNDKPVEFTHYLSADNGWYQHSVTNYEKIVHLGKCKVDGDMFAAYSKDGFIRIYKGHLNSGKY